MMSPLLPSPPAPVVAVVALVLVLVPAAPPAPPLPPAPPPPPAPGSAPCVTISSVPRPDVAALNAGAKPAAIGSKISVAAATSAGVSLIDVSSTIPSFHEVWATPKAGSRVPVAAITSSIVNALRVAVTVNEFVASNQGNEWGAYAPPQSGSVGVAGTTGLSSTPKGGTSEALARPIM